MLLKALVLVSLLIAVVYSHTCLVAPEQRGGVGDALEITGADECGKIEGPCGGAYRGSAKTEFQAGKVYSIVFQKNLDHFYQPSPGFFGVSVTNENDTCGEILAVVADSSAIPTRALVTVNITAPAEGSVLQLVYKTNNPNAPPYFYQCADITITKPRGVKN